jgi:hypothetical protein
MFGTSQLHDYWEPPETAESRALLARIGISSRAENQAAAQRLCDIAELFELRRDERGEREDWAVDTWAAVGAEIAAALRVSLAKAGSLMDYGLAMKTRPEVSALFVAGDIDMHMFQTIVYRTALITDDSVMAEVDRRLADRVARWPSMTRGRLAAEIDRIVARHDDDAVRRVRERVRDREVVFGDDDRGCAEISGRIYSTDAEAMDQRLDAMAKAVCDGDPRTVAQRRADAFGALAFGADRLACRCGDPGCAAAEQPVTGAVVIHVVADEATLRGRSDKPAYAVGADALIPGELLVQLAKQARVTPLIHPADAPPERGYRPSQALADFVRFRDLTCRAPGCDKPATQCDLDHTVPYPYGRTHAGNLKCLCREHHILKTFWGWRDRQLGDGTVIWTLPGDQTYITTPGSALLFPSLMAPTPAPSRPGMPDTAGDRTVLMPRRKTTRAQNRARYIASERNDNRARRRTRHGALFGPAPPSYDDDPPPF